MDGWLDVINSGSSAEIIRYGYLTFFALITIAGRRAIIESTKANGEKGFVDLMDELRDIDKDGCERGLVWILHTSHVERFRNVLKKLPDSLADWLAARATIVVTGTTSLVPTKDGGPEIEACTAFPSEPPNRTDEVTFKYAGHTARSGNDWTDAACRQIDSSPVMHEDIIRYVYYVANRAILENKEESFYEIAVSKLLENGFLIFAFQEFLETDQI